MAAPRAQALERLGQPAGGGDVIVLHQHSVIEAEAVVDAAAGAHRVFLEGAQARRRLAGAGDARSGAFDRGDVGSGERRDAAQMPKKIERGALGREQRPRLALDMRNPRCGSDLAAVGDIGNELGVGVERLEACRSEILPCDHARLARDDLGLGGGVSRDDRIGGDVAGLPEVLFQRGGDRAMDEEGRQFEL